MTEITITENKIEIDGHSGYGEFGSDIVCAGLSTTTYSIAEWCDRNRDRFDSLAINMDNPGYAYIEYNTDDYHAIEIIEAMTIGYELLADQFPDFVSFYHI